MRSMVANLGTGSGLDMRARPDRWIALRRVLSRFGLLGRLRTDLGGQVLVLSVAEAGREWDLEAKALNRRARLRLASSR